MKRSTLTAAFLTVAVHALGVGLLSLWSVGGGDAALEAPAPFEAEAGGESLPAASTATRPGSTDPLPNVAGVVPAPSSSSAPDTASVPPRLPEATPLPQDSSTLATASGAGRASAKSARKSEVTPVLMLSWQKGGSRRKTSGALPTLTGPLTADVTASFRVTVSPDGMVKSVKALRGKNAAFAQAAVARIRKWKFEPLRASRPTDQLCTVTLKAKAR